jgi:hypothetical protein
MCDTYTWQRRSLFIRDKPILTSERMFHKDYDRKRSVEIKIPGRESRGALRQDELVGGEQLIVK